MTATNPLVRFYHALPKDALKNTCASAVVSSACAFLYLPHYTLTIAIATATSAIFFSIFNHFLTILFNKICSKDKVFFSFTLHLAQLWLATSVVNLFYVPAFGFSIHPIYTIALNFFLSATYAISYPDKDWQSRMFFVIVH